MTPFSFVWMFLYRKIAHGWRLFRLAWGLGLVSMCTVAALADEVKLPESQQDRIAMFRENVDKILRQLDTKQGPGLAGWVALDDQVIYANWAGLAQRQPRLAIQGDTAFELASASKPLTATLAMQLVEAGLLGLDDSVRRWLPSLPSSWSDMTVRHLLTHRAGIPDYMKQKIGRAHV